jgi:hypothetical protein
MDVRIERQESDQGQRPAPGNQGGVGSIQCGGGEAAGWPMAVGATPCVPTRYHSGKAGVSRNAARARSLIPSRAWVDSYQGTLALSSNALDRSWLRDERG